MGRWNDSSSSPAAANEGRRRKRRKTENSGQSNPSVEKDLNEPKKSEQPREQPQQTKPDPLSFLSLPGCRSFDCFERLNFIDEGTYGEVFRARERVTGEVFAVKRLKMTALEGTQATGFPVHTLREITFQLSTSHENLVGAKEVLANNDMEVFIVMECLDHDVRALLDHLKAPFTIPEAKCVLLQTLAGVAEIHERWMVHRDLKTSNLLVSGDGVVKVADFGLVRMFCEPRIALSPVAMTLHYRPPEILLGDLHYGPEADMWSVGCIMFELLVGAPPFVGSTELEQLSAIFDILGTPTEATWPSLKSLPLAQKINFIPQPVNRLGKKLPPGLSQEGVDLLLGMLSYEPSRRPSAKKCLEAQWFSQAPRAKDRKMMPKFPRKHEEGDVRRGVEAGQEVGLLGGKAYGRGFELKF